MKTLDNISKTVTTSIKILFLLGMLNLIAKPVIAQTKSVITEVKGKSTSFTCRTYNYEKGAGVKTTVYTNRTYDLDKIYSTRIPKNTLVQFLWYKINNHDSFLKAFFNSFGKERITELAKKDVRINVDFILDKNGKILAIEYWLIYENDVTPFELEVLENELLNGISFRVMGNPNEELPGTFPVRTCFKEIEQGEIKNIRKNEKRMTE